MFVDGINPFGNKQSGHHSSITFIILVCLTLPFKVRYRPENIFIAGVVPGPREPSLEQMNWVLRPIVTQLQTLWTPGLLLSQTHLYKQGRLIRAALLPFIADIPALRRSLGFPSATATYFCSYCLLKKREINNFDTTSWPLRTCAQHRLWAQEARDAKTVSERKKIFKTHGVRYSVLIDLEYWDIIESHVVDSMHNLLLGLFMTHCRRFWAMAEITSEEDKLPGISTNELLDLYKEHSEKTPSTRSLPTEKNGADGDNVIEHSFDDSTDTSDAEFDPLDDNGWVGEWVSPPLDEIIFDASMLQHINSFLPRIHIPTWIKRAIPVLGKASFGKLKADEWRNLFSIQLPLVLIPKWSGHDQVKTSLLQNFCHLVSLFNLALKREITAEHIRKYCYHIREYLESSVILFQHCTLTPNHHMAIHLADCLERFGSVRAWWSFPYKRLMGNVLKACHNNHIGKFGLVLKLYHTIFFTKDRFLYHISGELEITFVKNFCRAGNLSALLQDEEKLPEELRRYIPQLKSFYEQQNPKPRRMSNSQLEPLSERILALLIRRLNDDKCDNCKWLAPKVWATLSSDDALGFAPVPARACFHKRVEHRGITYSNFESNPNDSFVVFRSRSDTSDCFGRISKIFQHRRSPMFGENIIDTWLQIQCFKPIPSSSSNPFARVKMPDMNMHLQVWDAPEDRMVRLNEIIAHCSWLMYKPRELNRNLNISTVALVSMIR